MEVVLPESKTESEFISFVYRNRNRNWESDADERCVKIIKVVRLLRHAKCINFAALIDFWLDTTIFIQYVVLSAYM